MPTDILRRSSAPKAAGRAATSGPGERIVRITIGRLSLRVRLRDTATADRLWDALPLYSTAEPWGEAVHFELPVAAGRDRSARLNGVRGEICYWAEERRVIIAYGPTPISRPGEIRMPRPVNVFADAVDDAGLLRASRPGEKVSLTRDKA